MEETVKNTDTVSLKPDTTKYVLISVVIIIGFAVLLFVINQFHPQKIVSKIDTSKATYELKLDKEKNVFSQEDPIGFTLFIKNKTKDKIELMICDYKGLTFRVYQENNHFLFTSQNLIYNSSLNSKPKPLHITVNVDEVKQVKGIWKQADDKNKPVVPGKYNLKVDVLTDDILNTLEQKLIIKPKEEKKIEEKEEKKEEKEEKKTE